jgi:hypothetical protein
MQHYPPFISVPWCSNEFESVSIHQDLEDYMTQQLNEHVLEVDVFKESSNTGSYNRGFGSSYYLGKPDRVIYTLKDGSIHNISFKSSIGAIIDKHAAPLYIWNITNGSKSPFIFVEEDTCHRAGKAHCPRIIVRSANYVDCHDLSVDQRVFVENHAKIWKAQHEINMALRIINATVHVPMTEPLLPAQDSTSEDRLDYARNYINYHEQTIRYNLEQEPRARAKATLEMLKATYSDVLGLNYDLIVNDSTFMEYFLGLLAIPVRIRLILSYIPSLKIDSGK